MSFSIAVIVTVVLVIACSKNEKSVSVNKESAAGWKESEKKIFMDDCMAGDQGSIPKDKIKIYCNCMMEKIMAKYPRYSQTVDRSKEEFNSMIDSCDKVAGIVGFD
jgi:hypothetical protein